MYLYHSLQPWFMLLYHSWFLIYDSAIGDSGMVNDVVIFSDEGISNLKGF